MTVIVVTPSWSAVFAQTNVFVVVIYSDAQFHWLICYLTTSWPNDVAREDIFIQVSISILLGCASVHLMHSELPAYYVMLMWMWCVPYTSPPVTISLRTRLSVMSVFVRRHCCSCIILFHQVKGSGVFFFAWLIFIQLMGVVYEEDF